MAKHIVTFKTPALELGSSDVVFSASADGKKIGTLKISQGTVEWVPANKSKKTHHLGWEQFAEAMEQIGWGK